METTFSERPPLQRAFLGALGGAFFAALALAVGAVRIVIALAGGTRIESEELQWVVFYVGGFVLAGAAVGLLWPLTRTGAGRYIVGVLGAAIGLLMMMRGVYGPPPVWDAGHWFSWVVCTSVFGIFLGRQLAD